MWKERPNIKFVIFCQRSLVKKSILFVRVMVGLLPILLLQSPDHIVGHVGLLERENASILNASISSFARRTVSGYQQAMKRLGLSCPLYLTQVCFLCWSSVYPNIAYLEWRNFDHSSRGCTVTHQDLFIWSDKFHAWGVISSWYRFSETRTFWE